MLTRILAAYGLYHVALNVLDGGRIALSATNFLGRKAPVVMWLVELQRAVPIVTARATQDAAKTPVHFGKTKLTDEDAARLFEAARQGLAVAKGPEGETLRTKHPALNFAEAAAVAGMLDFEKDKKPFDRDRAVNEILMEAGRGPSFSDRVKEGTASVASKAKITVEGLVDDVGSFASKASFFSGRIVDGAGDLADAVKDKLGDVDDKAAEMIDDAGDLWHKNKDGVKEKSVRTYEVLLTHFEDLVHDASVAARNAGKTADEAWEGSRDKIKEAISAYVPTEHGPFEAYVWHRVLPGVYVARKTVAPPVLAPVR